MRRAITILLLVAGALMVGAPAQARAAASAPDVEIPIFPVTSPTGIPSGFKIDALKAAATAKTSRQLQAIHRTHHPLAYQVNIWIGQHYEVYFFYHGKPIADVIVGRDGKLGPTYTGGKILGIYARSGFGQEFDSPWLLVPFTLMFLLPLALLRRRSWWDVADIAVVLTFGVSYWFFDVGHLEAGVWLAYPPLLYLLARLMLRGFRPRTSGGTLDVRLSTKVLIAGLLLLVAGRIVVTLLPSSVMDVGEASVIGAYKILHGQPIYYPSLGHADTYGPIMYLAYLPFQAIFPGDKWAYVPSARAAAITFDLLTIFALVMVGRRIRSGQQGLRLGLLMAWLWAACPGTVLGMVKSTNDGLVALLLVVGILCLSTPLRRGAVIGLAAAAKIFPAILLPLVAVGRRGGDERQWRKVLAAFVIVCGASIALLLPPGGLKEVYEHTLGYQLTRPDVSSAWALHPALAPIKDLIELGAIFLAVLVAFRPRGPRTIAQAGALTGALVIAVQLPALHWFYFYIAWFMPLVLIAVLGAGVPAVEAPPELVEADPVLGDTEPASALAGVS